MVYLARLCMKPSGQLIMKMEYCDNVTNAKSSLPSTLKSVIHEILRIHLQHAHNQ